mmetsp:Transcript_19435/g.41558  ORF Transcript_19435/g.41558 Transcript_19435/m.41558 type:complete len:170 (-) Transcript_19435:303-812(-)|eukprot:CAMPEP_0172551326 /NCGR_PEP_ID=MMETSP1067-20121228/38149_1 /TAXON_ID=265564 ORGANISM="Thalassiosira punctigera, Strain Tpunct2005C2" /NCGR_SAMPLE_ID=MMETSP1067 /ASSEMBLY_ACC=CAM_ASM_000444 /LENGTH=169 /DNA_ID=CAMNT_0013339095 /DNA_START=90 /DNA_END=599 /DNA_ORIENTATION=+
MGNRSSNASSTSPEGQDGGGSGLYLTPELQAKINSDFDSHIIQSEWDEYRKLHLQRHQQRETSSSLRHEEVRQQTEALRSRAKQVHDRLDEMVDAAKGRLVDLEVEVGHDVDRLGRKFEGSLSATTPEGKCLDVRAELSNCYNTLRDGGECQIFVQKLDKCVTEALASL